MINNYQKYIYKNFFNSFIKVTLIFSSIIMIMNLFEEISFFKENENIILLPIFLTIINIPSVLFEIFPFIFLISTLFFFIDTINKDEINVYKIYGITNLNLIKTLTFATFVTGIFVVLIFYNLSANLKFLYLDIKNQYTKDDKYLAVVTGNGLWIRDEIENNINYINADKLDKENLLNLTISEFNKDFQLKRVIISKKASIKTNTWILEKPLVNSQNNSKTLEKLEFNSNFDLERILSIFENLSSLNLFELELLKKDYELLGYNTEKINGYKHKLYSYPIYLTLMVTIASLLMLNIKHNKSKIFHITLGIVISVIIYYINYFFKVIIETQDVPYLISIWGPQIILFMVVLTSLIRINEK